ncbi:MAG: magnesium transporter [bacterium]
MRRALENLEEHKRELVNTLDLLLEQGPDSRGLIQNLLTGLHPADVADVLDVMDADDAGRVIVFLDHGTASDVLAEMEEETRAPLLGLLEVGRLASLVEAMDSDDATDLVADMDAYRAEEVLEQVDPEDRREIRDLMVYDEETAGGLMAAEFVAVPETATVDGAIEAIRTAVEEMDDIYYVYVVNAAGMLTGLLGLKDLLLAPPDRHVGDLMERDVVSVPVTMDQEEVARVVQQYDLAAVPVVDGGGRLVGRITHDDIVDVLEEESEEDIRRMAGVREEAFYERSSMKVAALRLPWIVTSLVSSLLAALIISLNSSLLERFVQLAFFFPVITAIGGNIGLQTSTIMVRGLATGQTDLMHVGSRILKESRVGVVMGLVCGVVVGTVSGFWAGGLVFGLIVGGAMLVAILVAATMGAIVPLVFEKVGVDPAVATGPFVTMSNDLIGLLIYFGLAAGLLTAFGLMV